MKKIPFILLMSLLIAMQFCTASEKSLNYDWTNAYKPSQDVDDFKDIFQEASDELFNNETTDWQDIDNIDDFLYTFNVTAYPEQLLQDPTFTQNIIDYLITLPHTKDNPIFAAAKLATPGALEWLRKYLKDPLQMKIAEQELIMACQNNDISTLNALLSVGVSPEATTNNYRWGRQYSALMVAIQKDSLQAFDRLLEAGADPNKQQSCVEKTPLLMATACTRIAMMERLFQKGAKPYIKDKNGTNITHYAQIFEIKRELKDMLSRYNYPYCYPIDHDGRGYAIGRRALGVPTCTKLVHEISCQLNCGNIHLFTFLTDRAIDWLAECYPTSIPWLIKQCNLLPHAKDNTIFIFASLIENQSPLFSFLTKYLKQNQRHWRLAEQELIIAAGNNNWRVVNVLLDAGVSPHARGKRGLTAYQNAMNRGANTCARLLQDRIFRNNIDNGFPAFIE